MEIFTLRFLVPPILTAVFTFLINPNLIKEIFIYIKNSVGLEPITATILTSTVTIFAIGFLISSIAYVIINKGGFLATKFDPQEIKILKKHYKHWERDFTKRNIAGELAGWLAECEHKEYIQNQMNKRWGMAMLNFNASAALVLSIAFGVFSKMEFRDIIMIGMAIVFIGVFYYNGKKAYDSVHEMTHILVRELGEISKIKAKSKIKNRTSK